jgi:serpin B
MKKLIVCIFCLALFLGLSGCAQSVVASGKDRITSPDVNREDMIALSDGNNTFAINLYQALKHNEGNFFYSPYSISSALAMAYAGARGETEKQIAETLNFTLPQEKLHPAFNSVSLALASRGQETGDPEKMGFVLNNVNAIWGQKGVNFFPNFLDVLAENYGAGMRVLDFVQEPEKSRLTINNWVSEQTEKKIQELLPEGSIISSVFLVLTNAIYFKANWFDQFDVRQTVAGQFILLNGTQVLVPVMHQTEYANYAEGDGYQAVELLYKNRKLSMVVLLPAQSQFEKFENSLQYPQLMGIISKLESRQVILSLPKFKFDSEFDLVQTLSKMGMPIAFSGGADFSGIVGGGGFIGGVYHDAFVSVDEQGTEAAASSSVMLMGGGGGPVEFSIDRPFIFLIRDIETNTVLFMGRVVNPLG